MVTKKTAGVVFSARIPSGLMATGLILTTSFSLIGLVMLPSQSGIANAQNRRTIRIAIGTQDQTSNTTVGGALVREEKLLERYLPRTGKYQNVDYNIEWSSYTSGPPITNKMIANQLDIGLMGDFPATINMSTFQQKGNGVTSRFIATLAMSPVGGGNAIMVPRDSNIRSVADLRGKDVSVPFGSAAHGMLLRALRNAGLNPDKDLKLISQSPEVGGTNLRTRQIDAHANFVPFGELFPFRGFARKIYDGAQAKVPTMHGVLVRSDFAQQYPEVVTAYLKAILEANRMFRQQPEVMSAKIEKWTGVEKEVVYMFLGPSGIQTLDPTITNVNLNSLRNSIMTLKQIGRLDSTFKPTDADRWVNDQFLRQAAKEMGMNYATLSQTAQAFDISGSDALTREPIRNPKLAAQIWVEGEMKVRSYASIGNMMRALQNLRQQNRKVSATFVQDSNTGSKLFANNSFFVIRGRATSAFLLESDARSAATAAGSGAKVVDFQNLRQAFLPAERPLALAQPTP